jgi:hypothetical protein
MPISEQSISVSEHTQFVTVEIDDFAMTVPFVPGFRLVSPKPDSKVVVEFPECIEDGKIIIKNAQACSSSIKNGFFKITVKSLIQPLNHELTRITSQFGPSALRYLIDFDKPFRPRWIGMTPPKRSDRMDRRLDHESEMN